MAITRPLLDEAVTAGVQVPHILDCVGGMIAIGAMTLFMTLGWERFGGAGLLLIACDYGIVALALTEWLRARPGLAIPAGVAATLAIVMVPLGVNGGSACSAPGPTDRRELLAHRCE